MLVNQLMGDIDSWSIKWSYTINKNAGVCLSPIYSYVSLIFAEGTHVKSYIESLDNNLDLSKRVVTYPEKVEVLTEIARMAAKVFHPKIPLLLKEDIEQKYYYKKYLIRRKLLHENVKNKPYYKKYLIRRKLLSTNKYLMKKVHGNENRWIRFLKSSYKDKLKIINKKLFKGLKKP